MRSFAFILLMSFVLLIFSHAVFASQETFHWQGKVYVNNNAFTGSGQFKFVLYDVANSQVIWTNDGAGVFPATAQEPAVAISTNVVNGLYSVALGETSSYAPGSMTALPINEFYRNLKMKVYFSDGVNGFQLLSPDETLHAVPYALLTGKAVSSNWTESISRMSTSERNAIVSPRPGMIIFNTSSQNINIYDGASWKETVNSSSPQIFKFPSMTTEQKNNITNPEEASLIYNSSSKNIEVYNGLAWGAVSPVGSMMMFAGATAPAGWLICDGRALSRTAYPALFAVMGLAFTPVDDGSTFNLPDMQGAAPTGVGTSNGFPGEPLSVETVALGVKYGDQFQGHLHQRNSTNATEGVWITPGVNGVDGNGGWNLTFGADTTYLPVSDGANGVPRTGPVTKGKTVGVNFIIKY